MNKDEFVEYLNGYTDGEKAYENLINQKKYFRINTLKIKIEEFKKISKLKCVQSKYLEEGFEFSGKEKLGNTWEYFLGFIHPQSLSSMVVSKALDPKEREYMLDMTSAPGGKTTHMSALMNNTG
ncbi:MAG: tRNA methyltransferase, partial [Candidatus ainarchaeum sp.]|nr:tRNA methyltransferase [Candidatus ainarchaeum sp.]